ncbi:unnamed protein product [Nippostrongylus brasiliensis]|uniref:Uncharacterized protein n=1 Tax=Nippostrongylus brasiliensis TaxID=27835 RepID=A0A0N4XW10_NIPBR|nr:unnamed protein product [Nippostrongylus brasiliensis]
MAMTADAEGRFSVENISDKDSLERADLVQMDSIPEDLTITVSPSVITSRLSIPYPFSGSRGSDSDWYQMNLRNRMETFGKRLSNWFNTLDYDGDFANVNLASEKEKKLEITEIVPESHASTSIGQETIAFAEVLSTGVIVLALFELYESSLQRSYSLYLYSDTISIAVFEMVYYDLEQLAIEFDYSLIEDFGSTIALNILNDVFVEFTATTSPDDEGYAEVVEDVPTASSSVSTNLSGCYEILDVEEDFEATGGDSFGSYSSFEYPSEPERTSDSEGVQCPPITTDISSLAGLIASVEPKQFDPGREESDPSKGHLEAASKELERIIEGLEQVSTHTLDKQLRKGVPEGIRDSEALVFYSKVDEVGKIIQPVDK